MAQTAPTITVQPIAYSQLYSFANSGANTPNTGLIMGTDGRLYGTTSLGGANGYGTVFAINTDGTGYTSIYSFTGGNGGGNPDVSLIQGSDGRLYGTTQGYGPNGHGVVYALNTDGTGFATLHGFTGGSDGGYPVGHLVQGTDGLLYGVANSGGLPANGPGPNGYGTVFAMATDGTGFTTLYNFTGNLDGGLPNCLIQGSDGRLYGTTLNGGEVSGGTIGGGAFFSGAGVVFSVKTDGTDFKTIYNFTTPLNQFGVSSSTYGAFPTNLIQGTDGRLYGATQAGGPYGYEYTGYGVVFAMNTDGSNFTMVHAFTNGDDGADPTDATLLQGTDGRLYGTTMGGNYGGGVEAIGATLYAVNPDGTGFTTLYIFPSGNFADLEGALVQGADSRLYGTTRLLGPNGNGSVFAVAGAISPFGSSAAYSSGSSVIFSVTAAGTVPLSYQWQLDGAGIAGATNPTLDFSSLTFSNDGSYNVVVSNSAGSVTSNAFALTVDYVEITQQPANQTVSLGQSAAFAVVAAGTPGPGYQWQESTDGGTIWTNLSDGNGVSGSGTATLDIVGTNTAMTGEQFQAVVTNSSGTVTSTPGTLTVQIPSGDSVAYDFATLAGLPPGSVDGTGNTARFADPGAVATDGQGNVYVADTENNTIRKITPGGVVTTLAGWAEVIGSSDGQGGAAQFNAPSGIALDGVGNIYVADTGNDTIRLITPSGMVTTLAGAAGVAGSADGIGGAAQFNGPEGLAVDGSGNLYVADSNNNTIRMIAPGGAVTTLAGTAGMSGTNDGADLTAQFSDPVGLALDNSGKLYVSDYNNCTIRVIALGGGVSTLAGNSSASGSADGTGTAAQFSGPAGIAVDGSGNILVVDSINFTIRQVTPGGVVTTLAGTAGVTGSADGTGAAAQFVFPYGVAVDGAGNAFIADSTNNTVRKIVISSQVVSTFAGKSGYGSADATGSAAQFDNAHGIAVDTIGNVYVADTSNETIRKVTPGGVVTTLAGTPGVTGSVDGIGGAARFNGPFGVAVDASGNVYVADRYNGTIRKITSGGVVSTLAGTPGVFGTANGTGAAAQFLAPHDAAVDGSGNVYVADPGNGVRKITPAGVVTTLAGMAGVEGVAVDGDGNVYAAVSGGVIRKITPSGVVTTLAGTAGVIGSADGAGSAAQFNLPDYIAVDASGNVYVGDFDNETIRKITPAGAVTTVGGAAGLIGYSNGIGAAARFFDPAGMAMDGEGSVYVMDLGSNTVRKGVLTAIDPAPAIVSQPSDQDVPYGGNATFSVIANGNPDPTYQWQFNGADIAGATGATLAISGVTGANAGGYDVVLTNANGTVTSTSAILGVEVPQITSLNPTTANSGSANDLSLTVNGAGFNAGDTVLWTDGSPLTTTFVSGNVLTAVVPAADLVTGTDVATELISVQSASGDTSNPEALSVKSTAVGQIQASVAPAGGSTTDSTAPTLADTGGITATLQNNAVGAVPAAVSVADYSSNPTSVAPAIDVGGQYVDLQVASVSPGDTVTAYFYYPSTVTGTDANNLQLLYFDGTNWDPVLSSGGAVPTKDETPNLDGTNSGGRFTVVFDATSTPTITALSGTVFTPSIVSVPPVIESVTPSPAYLTPPNSQMVPVTIAVVTFDLFYPNPISRITSVTSNEPPSNGVPEWQITGLLSVNLQAARSSTGTGRIYTITIQTSDSAGNKATQQTEVIVPKDKDALSDPPAIVTQPVSQTVIAGASVTFSVAAATALPITYQWLLNGMNLPGDTGTTLTLPSATLAEAGTYTVAATNSVGTTTSHKAKLTVNAAPSFTTEPQSVTASIGTKVTFTALAVGGPKPKYQWFRNGITISGGKSGTLTINKVKAKDAGTYTVTATNAFGSSTSSPAVLTVTP